VYVLRAGGLVGRPVVVAMESLARRGRWQGGMVVAPAMSYSPADSDKVIKFPSYADGNKTQLYDPAHCLELLSF